MKKEQIKTNLSLGAAAILSLIASLFLLTSCSPPNDSLESEHAGVLTETESGHTVAFAIEEEISETNVSAKKSGTVHFALTKIVDGKTELFDSTTVKYGEYAVFEDVKGAYSVVATSAEEQNNEKDTLFGAEILKRNDIDTVYVRVQKPATLKISTAYSDFINSYYDEELQDLPFEVASLCITGTLACKEITLDDIKRGYAILTDIPIFNNESSVKQIEIQLGSKFSTIGVDWNLHAGDTLFANENVVAEKVLYDINFTLPESDLFDSLGDYQLDSLIVPVRVSNDNYYRYENFFLDEKGHVIIPQFHKDLSSDTTLHWIVIPKIDSTAKLSLVSGTYNYDRVPTYTRLTRYWETADEDTLWHWINIFEDSSFAISFWIELDSLADSTVLLGNCDSLGFEIRRCQKDSTAICTRIYNGIDTVSTDSVEYGKANILDGKRHHYALVIHKKHLTIAVDGITIRDTDLKLSERFYKVDGIRAATGLVEDILFFSFGDYIRYKGDKSWNRLKAWLYAFYMMQK